MLAVDGQQKVRLSLREFLISLFMAKLGSECKDESSECPSGEAGRVLIGRSIRKVLKDPQRGHVRSALLYNAECGFVRWPISERANCKDQPLPCAICGRPRKLARVRSFIRNGGWPPISRQRAASQRRHHVFHGKSFSAVLSGIAPASNRCGRAFSSSRAFSRLAAGAFAPPNFAFHL